GVRTVSIESTDQLFKAVAQEFRQADCLIMAAAPADFAPARTTRQKIKKADVATTLALKPTVDILSQVAGSKKSGQIVVGFALETQQGLAHAKQKLNEKHLDMIVLNQPGRNTGFGSDTNRVTVLLPGKKPEAWPLMDKCAVAVKLLEKVASLR
ncbi:MAG TPA: phosphopantothenoylcysteine decarboxylase, partial [Candidatus Deferrimicrobium sp.]|nr:phosphopantothenoylcysteine decarboxylase [Candidatus Deferrimicrobium sp.]